MLAVDIGTTGMKMGVFQTGNLVAQFSQEYEVNVYNDGLFGDIEQDKWKRAFVAGCRAMEDTVACVDVVSLSGTTPGLTAMDQRGEALYPAILMLDQRSRRQTQYIIETVGMKTLLETTANMPVAGGCSLAGILWANDLSWNEDIAGAFGICPDRLPRIVRACESVGRVRKSVAQKLSLAREPAVLIGGNDAVLAAYSVGIENPGDIINVNGTCEITLVCLDRCLPSANYNIRAHVLPDRWLTLHVMNAGGKALDWFRGLFCSELSAEEFYDQFLPAAIERWLDSESGVSYVPYLMGSRYSQEPLKAQLQGLTQQTSREEILAAIIRGLCEYQKAHLEEIGKNIPLGDVIHVTGGAANAALIEAKSKWMRDCEYICQQQSSMKGAAMLALNYLENSGNPASAV
ncbi:MAG: FGGY-family carbohydrate kinase [Planctomycetota bacterium]